MKILQIGMIKINSKNFQLFLIATNLTIKIKQINNDVINLINNIKNNTISEIHAKENLNALNKIKKTEINKRLISNQKKLLVFFNELLDIILTENNNNDNNDNNNDNNNKNNDNDNNDNDNDNESESESESENDYKIKQINNYFKMIDESKSFEDQMKLFKKADYLYEH